MKSSKENSHITGDGSACSICLNELKNNDDICSQCANFKNLFHEDCLKMWLKVRKNCPLCRTEMKKKFSRINNDDYFRDINNLISLS